MTLKTACVIFQKSLVMKVQSLYVSTVENIVTKGEIAHDEQFLLLSQCFQKSYAAQASESVCIHEGKG